MSDHGLASRAGAWIAAAALAGCTSASGSEGVAHVGLPIVGGELSPFGAADDTVVLLVATVPEGGVTYCSGTMVAPNLVLTARHCVAYTNEGPFVCTAAGELDKNPTGGGRLGADLPAGAISVWSGPPPRREPVAVGERVVSSLSLSVCDSDIAFVVLDRALDLPLSTMRLHGRAQPSEHVSVLGFGLTADDGTIEPQRQRRYIQREKLIGAVGPDLGGEPSTVAPKTFTVLAHTLCLGDSGGPAASEETGAVLGILSLLSRGSCADPALPAVYTHVAAFDYLTDRAFEAAGAVPIPEPSPEDAGPDVRGMLEAGADAETADAAMDSGPDAVFTSSDASPEQPRRHTTPSGSCGIATAPVSIPYGPGALVIGTLVRRRSSRRSNRSARAKPFRMENRG